MILLRLEKLAVILAFLVLYFGELIQPGVPVFLGAYNSVDGSIYAVRAWDLLASLVIFWPICFYLIPVLLDRGEVVRFVLSILGLFILASGAEYVLDYLVTVLYNLPVGEQEVSDKALQFRNTRQLESNIVQGNLIILALSVLYGLSRDWIRKYRNRQRLKQDKLRAELNYLRTQINPHFLFNTLNSLYATALRNEDQQTALAILQLSGIMRYMLDTTRAQFVTLAEEIEQVSNYLNLIHLRFGSKEQLNVDFQHQSVDEMLRISPLLLMPFVENAVKHGLSADGDGYLRIKLKTDNNRLHFHVENSISPEKIALSVNSGIGLENVRRRLEVLYPDRHTLRIDNREDVFTVHLMINLVE